MDNLRFYALFKQGERSLDHLLSSSWNGFRVFYTPARVQEVIAIKENLEFLYPNLVGDRELLRKEVESRVKKRMHPISRLLTTLLGSEKWHVNKSGVSFVISVLRDLVFIVTTNEKPDDPWVIQLRRDCWLCTKLIRSSSSLWVDFSRADYVENYNMPLHLKHYSLDGNMTS